MNQQVTKNRKETKVFCRMTEVCLFNSSRRGPPSWISLRLVRVAFIAVPNLTRE